MKKHKTMAMTMILSLSLVSTVFAGTWQPQTTVQWRYQNDDGSYATGWVQDDGKYYYLDSNGIMLTDTRTPDGYYVGADGVWDGQSASSSVITVGDSSPAVGHTTSVPSTVYQPGIYQVGVDIPAGEYVLFAIPGGPEADFELRTDPDFASYEGVIDGGSFGYNVIVLLKDGQYLSLNDCTASPISEVPRLDSSQAEMYKIGYHIPAGTYHLYALDYSYAGYAILSSPTAMDWNNIVDIRLFVEDTSVTVENGQYLLLAECILAEETEANASGNTNSSNQDSYGESYGNSGETQTARPASRVVTAGATERLSGITSTPSTVYPEGIYEAGVNIPAGEYVLLANSDWSTSYEIRSNADFSSYDDIIDYCSFSYNAIIRLEDGQFLQLRGCDASPIEEVPQISYIDGEMFKVGYHIPAGTYTIALTDPSDIFGACYILSYPSDNYDVVLSSTSVFEGEYATITVEDGQYIQLLDCVLVE